MPLQIRRGTNAQRQILAVPLASGELLWTTDTQQLFIGDGATLANALTPVVGYNDENAQDAAAAIFTNGSHTDITFNYVDGSNTIDADVSISAFRQNVDMGVWSLSGSGDITTTGAITAGTITADSLVGNYKGSIFGDDSTTLVNSVENSINLDGTVKGDIIPDAQEAYDIGSPTNRFKDLYLSGSSLWLGMAQVTASGTAIDLPAGSTINGEPLGEIAQPGNNLNVNIIGDDSSILVNSSTNSFIGDLKGSVYGDDSTPIVNANDNTLNGNLTGSVFGVFDDTLFINAVDRSLRNISYFQGESALTLESENINLLCTTGDVVIGGEDEEGTYYNSSLFVNINDAGGAAFISSQFRDSQSTVTSLQANKYRGTIDSPTGIQLGDKILEILARGYDGSSLKTAADISVFSEGPTTGSTIPGRIEMRVGTGSGSVTFSGNSSGVWSTPGLSVSGTANISNVYGDFYGSLFADSSSLIFDSTEGAFMVANVDVIGTTGNTPSVGAGDLPNVNQWLEVSVNGNTRYIPLYA